MSKSWTIGARADSDLVIVSPMVSGRHCRLALDEDGYTLEDLGSTNGTYVNGVLINERVRVTQGDAITLGSTTPMPWPPEGSGAGTAMVGEVRGLPQADPSGVPAIAFRGEAMVIGRVAGCDLVVDAPMVSSRHARLFRSGDRVLIEDLGSANGTFVNGQRLVGEVAIVPGDRIGLGSYSLVLDPAVEPGAAVVARADEVPLALDSRDRERGRGEPWPVARRLSALSAQAPLIALLIIMAAGADVPAALGWLAAASVWFGLSGAVLAGLLDARRLREGLSTGGAAALGARLAVLGGLCLARCAVAWFVVARDAGLKAPGPAAVAMLALASAVGLAIGLLIVALETRAAVAWASIAAVMLVVSWLGGADSASARLAPWARSVAAIVPSRWAFEGLLLLESERRRAPAEDAPGRDLAEGYFPAESARMGVRADVIALGAMLIGLAAAAGFIATATASASASPPVPRTPPRAS